ncbi:hypothetical protein MASR1M90_23920 [Desulfovibrionales bacterium]
MCSMYSTFEVHSMSAILLSKLCKISYDNIDNQGCFTVPVEMNKSQASSAYLALPVWTALAIEIGLKLLLAKTVNDKGHRSHDLCELFKKLPDEIQEKLKIKTFNPKLHPDFNDKETFDDFLKRNRLIFQRWRYFHELESGRADTPFLLSLLLAIHEEIKPQNDSTA